LPINSTGYRFHFHAPGAVEAQGGDVVAHVIAWLNKEAIKLGCLAYIELSRQGKLFLMEACAVGKRGANLKIWSG